MLLPPLNEQKRIVAKIEALNTHSRKAREALEEIPALLDQFRQSVLAAAFRGDLTADWREKNPDVKPAEKLVEQIYTKRLTEAQTDKSKDKIESLYAVIEKENSSRLPWSWQYVQLDKICQSFQYGTSSKSSQNGRIPVLRMGNIQNGDLDWTDLVYSSDDQEIEKYFLQPGDVLFNRTNSPELVGKTSIFRGERDAIFARYLIRVKTYPELDSEYLNLCLNTNYAKAFCWQVKTDGVSQSNINAQKLSKFELPLCPIEEQKEVVRKVKQLFLTYKLFMEHYSSTQIDLSKLDQSILAQAFRGELVPQDPNDEPASVLLERIRSEREKLEQDKKTSGKGRRKKV